MLLVPYADAGVLYKYFRVLARNVDLLRTEHLDLQQPGLVVSTVGPLLTSWASQDQIETQKRAGRRQFEELDAEIFFDTTFL